jgi:hypothetical protein
MHQCLPSKRSSKTALAAAAGIMKSDKCVCFVLAGMCKCTNAYNQMKAVKPYFKNAAGTLEMPGTHAHT